MGEPTRDEVWFAGDLHYGGTDPRRLIGEVVAAQGSVPGVVNLEGALVEDGLAPEERVGERLLLRNHRALLPRLGVSSVGVANNHAGDGAPGEPTPGPPGGVLRLAPEPIHGGRLALVQVDLSKGVGGDLGPTLTRGWGSAPERVALFHVTGPPSYLPRPELRAAVDVAIGAGADLVVAHGMHVIGPVELRGRVGIVWGLGNLAMVCRCTTETDGILVTAGFVGGDLDELVVTPLRAGLGGEPARLSDDREGIFTLLEAIGAHPTPPGWNGVIRRPRTTRPTPAAPGR